MTATDIDRHWTRTPLVRQPIFDRDLTVVAHELVHPGVEPRPGGTGDTRATAAVVVNGVVGIGLDRLTDGLPALVPLPHHLLISRQLEGLGPAPLWLAIGTDVDDHPAVAAALDRLRQEGQTILLRDLGPDDPRWSLLDHADLATVDAREIARPERRALLHRLQAAGVRLVATHVDTPHDADEVRTLGLDFLQGSFFMRPRLVTGRAPRHLAAHRVDILEAVADADLDLDRVEDLIRRDLQLADRFLRYVNAAAFGVRGHIDSIRHALMMLGTDRVRRWITLVVLAGTTDDKPDQLFATASVRAQLCESVGERAGLTHRRLELFMVGMFSLLDAVLDLPLAEAIEGLPLTDDARGALLGQDNELAMVLDAVVALQAGDWDHLERALGALALPDDAIATPYLQAISGVPPS